MILRGKVIDADTREPLSQASVVLYDSFNDPTGIGKYTNSNGEFVIEAAVLPGSSVVVSYNGFTPVKLLTGMLSDGSTQVVPLVRTSLPAVVVTPKKKSYAWLYLLLAGSAAIYLLTQKKR